MTKLSLLTSLVILIVSTIIWHSNLTASEVAQGTANQDSSLRYRIIVVKHLNRLYLLDGADTLRVYPVAVGKVKGDKQKVGDYRTPEGKFYINRIVDSSAWEHDFAGDNQGPVKGAYGPWFLGLYTGAELTKPHKTWKGIAIHGTHDPSSIGTMASEGCIRMHNKDIKELKGYANLKMPVQILP